MNLPLIQAMQLANDATIGNHSALLQIRAMRILIQAAEARITELSDDAIADATCHLAAIGESKGGFEAYGHRFQLQITEKFNFADYNRYKGEKACDWRRHMREKETLMAQSKALTKIMAGLVDAYKQANPDAEPDERTASIKCID